MANGHMGQIAPARRRLLGHQRCMQALQSGHISLHTQIRHGGKAVCPSHLHSKGLLLQFLKQSHIRPQRLCVIFLRGMYRFALTQPAIGQRDMRLARVTRQQGIAQPRSGLPQRLLQRRIFQHHHPDGAPRAALMPFGKISILTGL